MPPRPTLITSLTRMIVFALMLQISMPAQTGTLLPIGRLSELVQTATKQNPGLAAQRATLASARESDNIARAALFPQLSFAGSKSVVTPDNNNNDSRRFSLSARQQVFNMPLKELHNAGKSQVVAAESRFAGQEQSLQLSVIVAWLDFQLSRELTRLTKARISIATEQLTRAQSFVEAGLGTVVDVLDAKARLAALRADLLQQQYNTQFVQDRIFNLSGMHGAHARLNEDSLRDFDSPGLLGDWLAKVSEGSFESAAARADLESARARVRAADKALYPRLILHAETSTTGRLSEHEETIRFSLEQPLFTGGQASAEARRAASFSKAARETTYFVKQQEELRVRELHGRASLAPSRWSALEAAAEAAQAALEAVTAGYENGVRIAADVLDAEEILFDARLQLRQARYNYLKDLAALHALAGQADEQFIGRLDALFTPDQENADV